MVEYKEDYRAYVESFKVYCV